VQRISDESRAACELPDVARAIAWMGFEIKCSTPEVFAAEYKKEVPVWERLIKQSGAKLE
jgi:tripartite-type tricarboxylate transporter receptor subunit TctC